MAEALGSIGEVTEGLAALEGALDGTEEDWLIPELLRIKADLLVLRNAPCAAAD